MVLIVQSGPPQLGVVFVLLFSSFRRKEALLPRPREMPLRTTWPLWSLHESRPRGQAGTGAAASYSVM